MAIIKFLLILLNHFWDTYWTFVIFLALGMGWAVNKLLRPFFIIFKVLSSYAKKSAKNFLQICCLSEAGTYSRLKQLLMPNHMSSEESGADEEPPHKIVKYNVRKLPRESRALRRAKRKLDRLRTDSLSHLVQRRIQKKFQKKKKTRLKNIFTNLWSAVTMHGIKLKFV